MNIFLSSTTAATGGSGVWVMVLEMAAIVGIFYFLLMRPQQKKKKNEEKMRNNIQVGDDITTIGGIVGRIVGIKEDADMLILETGTDRAKIKIKKWAVGSVDTIHEKED